MPRFREGERVRIVNDLTAYPNAIDTVGIHSSMLGFQGQIVTIFEIENREGNQDVYYIEEDNQRYCWAEEWFERVFERDDNYINVYTKFKKARGKEKIKLRKQLLKIINR